MTNEQPLGNGRAERPLNQRPAARPAAHAAVATQAFDPAEVEKARGKVALWGWVTCTALLVLVVMTILSVRPGLGAFGGWAAPVILISSGVGIVNFREWRRRLRVARNRPKGD